MKTTITLFSFLLLLFCCPDIAWAQEMEIDIEINNLRAKLDSKGRLARDGVWLEAQGPNGWAPLVSDVGLWVAGVLPDGNLSLRSTTAGGEAYIGNPAVQLDRVWTVTAEEIAAHRADFADNGQIEEPIPAIFAWPGRWNPHFQSYNDLPDPLSDHSMAAHFFDVDGDGLYNPAQGDFPVAFTRGCDTPYFIPSVMHWCAFTMEEAQSGFGPLEVHILIFGFGCLEDDHPLNNTLFVQQLIINRAEAAGWPTDAYWGQWADVDLGCPFDDYVGAFPAEQAAYVYNATPEDCEYEGADFGSQPPSLAMTMLEGPIDQDGQPLPLSSIMYINSPGTSGVPVATTDPVTLVDSYNYLQGRWRDGSPLTSGGTGYGGAQPTDFAFPGLPEQAGGWSEHEAQNPLGDRRLLLNYGPMTLLPGAVNEVTVAYTLYDGPEGHLEKAALLHEQVKQVRELFDNCWQISGTSLPPCSPVLVNAPSEEKEMGRAVVFPNPASHELNVSLPGAALVYRVELFDLHGRRLSQQALPSGEHRLALPALPAGLYLLVIESADGSKQVERIAVAR
jgi:hypothetical protein